MRSRLAGEFLYDEVELREFLARKPLLENSCELSVVLREKREVALRAAHVSGKDQMSPCS